jgi:hypothetical protein
MPTFNAIVTTQSIPAVGVTTIGTPSYEDIRKSLGDFVYKPYQIYLQSSNFSQLSGVMQYKKYDVDGSIKFYDIIPFVSPFQQQKTIFIPLDKETIVDGRNAFNFILQANTTLKFKLFSQQISKETFIDDSGKELLGQSNFKAFETATGQFNFFEDFNNNVEWQSSNNPLLVKSV